MSEPLTREDVRAVVHQVLDERHSIDEATHRTHHDYVGALIEREQDCRRMRQHLIRHILGWGSITVIGGLVYALGDGLLAAARRLLNGG